MLALAVWACPTSAEAQLTDRAGDGRGGAGAGHGAVWVVVPGQARRLEALVAPRRVGDEIAPGWRLERVEVEQRGWSFELRATGEGTAPAACRLRATLGGSDWTDHPDVSWQIEPAPETLPPAAVEALRSLRDAALPRTDAALLGRIAALRGEPGGPPADEVAGGGGRGLDPDLAAWLALLLGTLAVVAATARRRSGPMPRPTWGELVAEGAPAALLLVGLWVRVHGVGLAGFGADEVGFFEATQRIVLEGRWPVLGPQVSGGDTYHPGGLFYWIMAIPAALGRDPRLAGLFTALLSIGGLALAARMVREVRGRGAAIAFAGLAALSPWYTAHGDRLDNSSVSVWLGAVALYGLHRMHLVPRSRWVGAVVVALAVLPQLHLSAPVLWGVAAGQLLLWRPRVHWPALAVGVTCAALLNGPYLLWEAQHGFANTQGLLGSVAAPEGHHESPLWSGVAYLFVLGTGHVGYLIEHEFTQHADQAILWSLCTEPGRTSLLLFTGPWVATGIVATMLFAAVGWGRGLARGVSRLRGSLRLRDDPAMTALLFGGATALALLVWRDHRVYPHYVNLLLPIALVPLVDGLLLPLELAPTRRVAALVTALVIGAAACFGVLGWRYYSSVEAPTGIAVTVGVAERVLAEADGREFRFDSDQPTPDGLRAVAHTVLGAPWRRSAGARLGFTTVADDPREVSASSEGVGLWHVPPLWLVRTSGPVR